MDGGARLPIYHRYVRNRLFCSGEEVIETKFVPALDTPYCPLYRCVPIEFEDFNRRRQRPRSRDLSASWSRRRARPGNGGRRPRLGFDELMAVFAAEGGNVDDGERVGGLDPEAVPGGIAARRLRALSTGSGHFKPEIVDLGGALTASAAEQMPSFLRTLLSTPVPAPSSAGCAAGVSVTVGWATARRAPRRGLLGSFRSRCGSRFLGLRLLLGCGLLLGSLRLGGFLGVECRHLAAGWRIDAAHAAVSVTEPSALSDGGSIGTRSPRARRCDQSDDDAGFLDAGDGRLGRRHASLDRAGKGGVVGALVGVVGALQRIRLGGAPGRRRSD